jgi:hypothetical protein
MLRDMTVDAVCVQHHAEAEAQRRRCGVLRQGHPPAAHAQRLGLPLHPDLRQGANC